MGWGVRVRGRRGRDGRSYWKGGGARGLYELPRGRCLQVLGTQAGQQGTPRGEPQSRIGPASAHTQLALLPEGRAGQGR